MSFDSATFCSLLKDEERAKRSQLASSPPPSFLPPPFSPREREGRQTTTHCNSLYVFLHCLSLPFPEKDAYEKGKGPIPTNWVISPSFPSPPFFSAASSPSSSSSSLFSKEEREVERGTRRKDEKGGGGSLSRRCCPIEAVRERPPPSLPF